MSSAMGGGKEKEREREENNEDENANVTVKQLKQILIDDRAKIENEHKKLEEEREKIKKEEEKKAALEAFKKKKVDDYKQQDRMHLRGIFGAFITFLCFIFIFAIFSNEEIVAEPQIELSLLAFLTLGALASSVSGVLLEMDRFRQLRDTPDIEREAEFLFLITKDIFGDNKDDKLSNQGKQECMKVARRVLKENVAELSAIHNHGFYKNSR